MNRFVYLNKWQGRRVPRNVVFGKGPRVYMCARARVYVCEREAACVRCLASRSSPAKLPGQSRASSTATVYLQVTLLFIWRLSDWLGFCKGHLVDTDTRPQARASPHVYFAQSFFFPFFRIASFIWNFIWYFGVQHGYLVCTISNERFVRKPVESQTKTVQSYLFSHLNRFDRKLI